MSAAQNFQNNNFITVMVCRIKNGALVMYRFVITFIHIVYLLHTEKCIVPFKWVHVYQIELPIKKSPIGKHIWIHRNTY